MIDKVKINKEIELDTSKFSDKMYLDISEAINYGTGEVYRKDCYKCKVNDISIIYSNTTNKLTIEGRLINSNYSKNRIYNYDDYLRPRLKEYIETKTIEYDDNWLCDNSWYDYNDNLCFPEREEEVITFSDVIENHSVDEIIDNINSTVNSLIRQEERVDIRDFNVTLIEICFNVWLESQQLVQSYISMFNHVFKTRKPKEYKNFVIEHKLDDDTSFYIKTNQAYKDNLKDNYVVNFYNKLSQLESIKDEYKVTGEDLEIANGCLRLEVQMYHKAIKRLSKEYGITNQFRNFLDVELCKEILEYYYERFIAKKRLNFYSYSKAKSKIENTNAISIRDKKNLLKYIREKHQQNKKHSRQTQNKYRAMLECLGIADVFIPSAWKVDRLKSPIRLLNQKLSHYQKMNKKYLSGTLRRIHTKEFTAR